MLLLVIAGTVAGRRSSTGRDKFTKDNDPVHYMRELEFRNTIDQYDLAIVLFFRKDVEDCKKMLPGFRYTAHKSKGRADFIALSAKTAQDLCEELGVDKFPTILSFRSGHLISNLENYTKPKLLYYYVKNVTTNKYFYVHDSDEAHDLLTRKNTSMVVAVPTVDARVDRLLSGVFTKYFEDLQILVATTPEIAKVFGIPSFPGISMMRSQDDANITYDGDVSKATVKSLMNFAEKNVKARFEITNTFDDDETDIIFTAFFDTADHSQGEVVRSVLDRVATDYPQMFKIRYADSQQMRRFLVSINMQNATTPLFMFLKRNQFGWQKWVFAGKPDATAVSSFCGNQIRGRNKETIVDYPVEERHNSLLKFMTGSELHDALQKQRDKDFVVNFVGFPCAHCDEVDELFVETANWAKENSIRSVVFARVNASCNDIPTTVWKNETFPYGWFFPAKNRGSAFPIGKRRQLYWMAHLLKDNMTEPFRAAMPPKPPKQTKTDEL